MRTKVIYKLEFTFDELLECNEELKNKFNSLTPQQQDEFIVKNISAIGSGMSAGTDCSIVMNTVAEILTENF